MAEKYNYNILDFPNTKIDVGKLSKEIRESNIVTALDYINTTQTTCDIWFKAELSMLDSTATLPAIIDSHDGERLSEQEPPTMEDGRPLVRADTRPLTCETYFTCAGDDVGIGDGRHLQWDFSDSTSDIYTGTEVPDGMKAKEIIMTFNCPVYLKDGALYFFDAPWNCYLEMDIVVPAGNYYPNPAGGIPASALGLGGTDMYAYASVDTPYQKYVNKHHIYGSCPMGDELNAEGAAVNPVPVGWYLRGLIMTPESDNVSKGYGALEMYRCHTMLLPGQTMESIHA
jgi:hypothetical protein